MRIEDTASGFLCFLYDLKTPSYVPYLLLLLLLLLDLLSLLDLLLRFPPYLLLLLPLQLQHVPLTLLGLFHCREVLLLGHG